MRYVKLCSIVFSLIYVETQALNFNHRKISRRYQAIQKQPNILVFIVDQLRSPVVYESHDLRSWQRENLQTMTFLRDNGVNFDHHYSGSIACAPSRATLFTGQYPSLHGVSQTNGAAKPAIDSTMFWLSPFNVPTAGNIFTEGNYATYYIGKWHISNDDLYDSGTPQNVVLSYDPNTGELDPHLMNVYRSANMLNSYGFGNGWVGPEPHGSTAHESGASAGTGVAGRDAFYADETISTLNQLNTQGPLARPWFVVCSFVNPHDISLYGEVTKHFSNFSFDIDPSLPSIPPAPTAHEDLSTKPIAQQSYKYEYQRAMQPTIDTEEYRKLYYSLQKKVDAEVGRVLDALLSTRFKNNTIVIFTSDHGELLGAHSNFQKWFNMYEESIHVPLIMYSPTLLPQGTHIDIPTSHVDVLPTLCGLANVDVDAIIEKLQATYTNSTALVGRNLSSLVYGTASSDMIEALNQPILFQTFDQIFTGAYSENPVGIPYSYVSQPAFIDAIITQLHGKLWKFAKYYENRAFESPLTCTCSTPVVSASPPIQFEMYNLTDDPLETQNLVHILFSTPESLAIRDELAALLEIYISRNALQPVNSRPYVYVLPQPS